MTNQPNLIEGLTKLAEGAASLIAHLQQQIPEEEHPDTPPEKECTYAEARAVLAEKSRTGFRAEVKAILTRHGAAHLSDIQDPKTLAIIKEEAIRIG